jgi:hypothetical protein
MCRMIETKPTQIVFSSEGKRRLWGLMPERQFAFSQGARIAF